MQMTNSLVAVATQLLSAPGDKYWGYDLSRETGVRSGVLYPILGRMLERGWLEDGWEDGASYRGKRPPRRYYTLTPEGLEALGAISRRAAADARFQNRPRLGYAGA
jgi:PadR family transcriptional regulator PadR